MSADNFNTVIQLPDGKWVAGANYSMSEWLDKAQASGYWAALRQVMDSKDPDTEFPMYDTPEQAAASLEGQDAEYGTSVIEYDKLYEDYKA